MLDFGVILGGTPHRVMLLHAERRTPGPGPVNEWHRHAVYHIIYIFRGTGVIKLGDDVIGAETGMLFLVSPNEWHQFFADTRDPFHYYEITFELVDPRGVPSTKGMFDLLGAVDETVICPELRGNPIIAYEYEEELIDAFLRVLERRNRRVPRDDPFDRAEVSVRAMELLLKVGSICHRLSIGEQARHGRFNESWLIDRAKQFIRKNRHLPVTLSEMAAHVHLNPSYFSALFKRETGMPPTQYLTNVRLAEARKLLRFTDLPITQVADACGFRSTAYFSRLFREVESLSPSEYRKRRRAASGEGVAATLHPFADPSNP